jgi:cytochrome c553
VLKIILCQHFIQWFVKNFRLTDAAAYVEKQKAYTFDLLTPEHAHVMTGTRKSLDAKIDNLQAWLSAKAPTKPKQKTIFIRTYNGNTARGAVAITLFWQD